jgi:hypothetical protein
MSSTGNSSSSSAASGGAGGDGGGAAAPPTVLPDDPSRTTPSTLLKIYGDGAQRVYRAVELFGNAAARDATFIRLSNIGEILTAATDPSFEPATAEQLAAASLGAGARGAASAASSAVAATVSAVKRGRDAMSSAASLGGSAAMGLSAAVRSAVERATSKEAVKGLRGIYQTIAEIAVSGGRLTYEKMGEILSLIIRAFSSLRTGIYEGIEWAKTMGQLTYGFLQRRLAPSIETYTTYYDKYKKFVKVESYSRRGAKLRGFSEDPKWEAAKNKMREYARKFVKALSGEKKRSRVEATSGVKSRAGVTAKPISFLDKVILAISSEEYGKVTARQAAILILIKAYITLLIPAREAAFAEGAVENTLPQDAETWYQSTTKFFKVMMSKLSCGLFESGEEGGYSSANSTASLNVIAGTKTPLIPLTPEEFMITIYSAFNYYCTEKPEDPITNTILSIVNLTPISDTIRRGVTLEQVTAALASFGVDMRPTAGGGGGGGASAATCIVEEDEEEGGGGASSSSSGSVFSGVDYNPYGSFTSSAPSAPPALAFARNAAMNAFADRNMGKKDGSSSSNSSAAPPAAKRAPEPVPEDPSQEGGARRTRNKRRTSQKKVRKVKKQVRKTRHHKKRTTRRR